MDFEFNVNYVSLPCSVDSIVCISHSFPLPLSIYPSLYLFLSQLGKNVESITMIYDLEGLGMKHLYKPAIETYGEVWPPWGMSKA